MRFGKPQSFTVYVDMRWADDEVEVQDVRLNTKDDPPDKGSIRVLVPASEMPNLEKNAHYRVTFKRIAKEKR